MKLAHLIKKYNKFNHLMELPADFGLDHFVSALCNANPKIVLHTYDTAYLRPSIILGLMTVPTHIRIPGNTISTLSAEVLNVLGLINQDTGFTGDDTPDVSFILHVLHSSEYDRLSKAQMDIFHALLNRDMTPRRRGLLVQTVSYLSIAIDEYDEKLAAFKRTNIPNLH